MDFFFYLVSVSLKDDRFLLSLRLADMFDSSVVAIQSTVRSVLPFFGQYECGFFLSGEGGRISGVNAYLEEGSLDFLNVWISVLVAQRAVVSRAVPKVLT